MFTLQTPQVTRVENDDIHPFQSDGLFNYALHANASGGGVEVLDPTLFFTESVNNPSFEFKQILTTNDADHFKDNDTLYFTQKFNNLYALDDGSAEASYGVNVSGGKVAMRFNLAQADSLKALQLHFQQNLNDVSATAFQIVVWEMMVVFLETPYTFFLRCFIQNILINTMDFLNTN